MNNSLYDVDEHGMIISFRAGERTIMPYSKINYEEFQMIRAVASAIELANSYDVTLRLVCEVYNQYVFGRSDDYCKQIIRKLRMLDYKDNVNVIASFLVCCEETSFGEDTCLTTLHFISHDKPIQKIDHICLIGSAIQKRYFNGDYGKAVSNEEFWKMFKEALNCSDDKGDSQ